MARKTVSAAGSLTTTRRRYPEEFRREAVQMMLDGHSAASVAERMGVSSTTLLYRWKQQLLDRGGPVAASLDERVRELEAELLRVERERDILKKALAIFGRNE
jgi:transposase